MAGGALLGAGLSRRSTRHPGALIGGAVVAASVPDVDLLIPTVLDQLGIEHRLDSGVHHRWATHTPLFWGLVCAAARAAARAQSAPAWAPEAARVLMLGVALHLLQDAVANTVSLLWPVRREEYGLGLDGLGDVTDHVEYVRRYPASPAGKLEGVLAVAAIGACAWRLTRRPRASRRW
jgi:membrane-bound metal-dependent hydrolase YbcI (DUF457 family)